MITSSQNSRIKEIRLLNAGAKNRKKAGFYVAEGVRLLEEVVNSGQIPELVVYTEELNQRGLDLIERFKSLSVTCEMATPKVLQAASDTETPQGILAVMPLASLPLPDSCNLLMILDAIRDPGNLGTLMRTCLAAGVDGLLLGPGTVDPFSPKVVRSAMGAHYKLPFNNATWKEIADLTRDLEVYLSDMGAGTNLWEADLTHPLAIILGGEAHGPGQQARQLAEQIIHIPITPEVESLNAASAGAILLFEVNRQRRFKAN